MIRFAALPEVSPRNAVHETEAIQAFIERTCQRVVPLAGKAADDQIVQNSPLGRFSIRAFRLTDFNGKRGDQIGLLIRREEIQSVSLLRGTGDAALSPQQREAALLLAQGKSNREIATELSLSLNTTNYHVKQVFTRLRVHNRKEVERELLKLAHEETLRSARDDERLDAAGRA